MIEIRVESYTYPNGRVGLKNFRESFEGGEFIVGSTATGKSTLLKMLNGLVPYFTGGKLEGSVKVFGERPSPDKVFLVKQNPEEMISCTEVFDEIVFPMIQKGVGLSEARREAECIAEELGIAHLMQRKTFELSTGELQLVEIASAVASGAKIIVLDEPFANLSQKNAANVIKLLRSYFHIVSEHRLEYARFFKRTINLGLKEENFEFPEAEVGETIFDGEIELRKGEIVAVVGENGVGKTMLLKRLATQMRKMKMDFSIVLQNPSYHLVEDKVKAEVSTNIAGEFGLQNVLERHPQSLSFGEMRRVAIAKAFKSEILLLDEPTAGQDFNFKRRLFYLLRKHRKTAVIATHDIELAKLCDRVVKL